jgi:hypothetical protein
MTRSSRATHPFAFAFAFAVAAASGATAPSEDLTALLRRLSEHSARLQELRRTGKVTMTTRTEQLDGKGRVESQTELVERVFFRDGAEVRELLRLAKNGKDVTAEERGKRAKKEKRGSSSLQLSVASPFGAEEAGKYRFTIRPPEASHPSLVQIHFEPVGEPSPAVNVGEALVDPAAGSPIRIRCHPSVNPRHVSRMEIEMRYEAETPYGPALSAVSIEGVGGILFIKKGFRTTVTFSGDALKSAP